MYILLEICLNGPTYLCSIARLARGELPDKIAQDADFTSPPNYNKKKTMNRFVVTHPHRMGKQNANPNF
jgi:hypothetical protein